jgi:hypothetical protein
VLTLLQRKPKEIRSNGKAASMVMTSPTTFVKTV